MLGYKAPPAHDAPHRQTRQEFGWAHITSGGTVANIEALWVARNVRYFPLAVRSAVVRHGIPLGVKLAGDTTGLPHSLSDLNDRQCLAIKPNEAIFLLPRFIESVRRYFDIAETDAIARAWDLIKESGYSIASHGTTPCYQVWPPAVFASGAVHYSLLKSADVLGIGKENVILVDVDRHFRMDARDLEQKVADAMRRGLYPLAVVAIAGTTEEGAVDPVHQIDEFRRRLESETNTSFWLHVDAAWSGYIRTLFVSAGDDPDHEPSHEELIDAVSKFAHRRVQITRKAYSRTVDLHWGGRDVCEAFLAFPRAESITVDPHKMGYVPYPSGVAAFRNDRVRLFLTQEAPYITVTRKEDLQPRAYEPPDNIGPFILEGSKPGAAAAACWLSHRMIPPNREGYGEIMRASLLAARELYERLAHWEQSAKANREQTTCQFVPVTIPPPDTNIVCFVIRIKGSRSLARMNALGEAVYKKFTIEAELGDREYSYAQPFFVSRTRFHSPQYSEHSVADLLERADADAAEYPEHGIFVLRATVMSPYLVLAAETGHKQDLLADFVEALAATAEAVCQETG
jgi:glutamate/tyrosine decarboxylase-like PLP-dependent enzyme